MASRQKTFASSSSLCAARTRARRCAIRTNSPRPERLPRASIASELNSSLASRAGSTTGSAFTPGTSFSRTRSSWASAPGSSEERDRARFEPVGLSGGIRLGLRRVHEQRPGLIGKVEFDGIVVRVHQHEQVVVHDRRAALVALGEAFANHEASNAAREGQLPVLLAHFPALGREPDSVLGLRVSAPAKKRMALSQRKKSSRKLSQRPGVRVELPVDPGELAVVTVSIVVAELGASHFVAGHKERHTLREQQRREEVTFLLISQIPYRNLIGGALHAAVPAAVVVRAVAVAFQIGFVTLTLVAHEVVQSEAVVRGHEVDASDGRAAAALENILGARDARGELAD